MTNLLPKIPLPTAISQIRIVPANRNVLQAFLAIALATTLLWLHFGSVSWVNRSLIRKSPATHPTSKPRPSDEAILAPTTIDLTAGDYSSVTKNDRPPNDLGFGPSDISPETNETNPSNAKIMAEFHFMKQRVKVIETLIGVESQWPEVTR